MARLEKVSSSYLVEDDEELSWQENLQYSRAVP